MPSNKAINFSQSVKYAIEHNHFRLGELLQKFNAWKYLAKKNPETYKIVYNDKGYFDLFEDGDNIDTTKGIIYLRDFDLGKLLK